MSKIQGTLAQWRDRLRRKELSPAELVNLTADAIEADRTTNAYISFDREAALHAAAGADISSPLAGIPIAVKDNINVLGQPTRCASRLLSPYVAPYDATSIRLLKEAGGIPLGRTNMDEFAMGASGENSAYGITRNPEARTAFPALLQRLCRRRRIRYRRCRTRFRHGRLHPATGRALRYRGPQAYLRARFPLRTGSLCLFPGPDRPHDPDSGRRRHPAPGHLRTRP